MTIASYCATAGFYDLCFGATGVAEADLGLAIEYRAVKKSLGGRTVLDGFDLVVEEGETLALLGRSGGGKTTALKLANRLIEADSGAVRVLGEDVASQDPIALRRRIGWVIQEIGLLPHWSVVENVETVPRLLGWDPARRRRRAEETLVMVGLSQEQFAHRRPSELSGGQRQRVGVARAIAADPPLLLMDEPFGALDPIARRQIQEEFLVWKDRLKKTVLFVTHDVREAFRLADRVALIESGRVHQVGTPDDLARRPADAFVRDFLAEPVA
jgi:osmoprotectant transport system ATP-binding protein